MTNADFTIADVLAWARTKPADARYNYQDRGGCALCQFLADTGRAKKPFVDAHFDYGGGVWRDGYGPNNPYPSELEYALGGDCGLNGWDSPEWTFGGLVTRLKALYPETPVTQSDWAAIDAYLTDIEQVSDHV